jgi:TonB-dependent starch-binding outer membrane protein SusC
MLLITFCKGGRLPDRITKTIRVVKITATILLIFSLHVAAKSVSQTITLSGKDIPLETILSEIKKQSGYFVLYTAELIKDAKPLTIDVKEEPLLQFLDETLGIQGLGYELENKTIILKKKPLTVGLDLRDLPSSSGLKDPPIDVKGRVLNEKGEPVIASIQVKGMSKGTTTNENGYFELKGLDSDATLLISGVSITPMEVEIAGRINLSITVKIAMKEEEDVVVKTNYWETKQRFNPGNISKVSAKDIEKSPAANALSALQARVAGIEIIQQTGIPGGNFAVRIRGQNSIINGNDPLYIVDGVPYYSSTLAFPQTSGEIYFNGSSPLNGVNPADIESIEILKDADATAIYGSRGANGVVLITTKKGKAGKTKVDINFYSGVGKVARKMDLMNTRQYLDMRYEAFRNDGIDWALPDVSAFDLKVWDTTRYTDWQKVLLGGTARYVDGQVSISGGEKYTQFSAGGGYRKESTVFPGDNDDQRISTHLNLTNTSPNQKLRTTISVNYISNNTNLPRVDLTGVALILSPNAPSLYDATGNLNWDTNGWYGNNRNTANPLSYTKTTYESKTNTLIGNATVGYNIHPRLQIKTSLGFSNVNMNAITVYPRSALDPDLAVIAQNSSVFSKNNLRNWIVEPQVNWSASIGNGELKLLAGTSFIDQVNEGNVQNGNGYSSEVLMKNINAADVILKSTAIYTQYRYHAVFGRVNYSLQDKYIINLTARRDGSTRFGPGKQFANFGAIGSAWIFSEENFVQTALPFLSFGKLRVSYGISGNDQIGDYQYLDTYSPAGSGVYMGSGGLNPQRLHNPDFAWETVRKFEMGFELGVLKDRLLASVSYYRNRSSNQLVGLPLPPTTGFSSIQSNLPALVQNTGVELELNSVNFQNADFTWATSINLTIPKNKLIEFPGLESSQYTNIYVIGQPLSVLKQYRHVGVNTSTGIYEFQDVDNDGSYGASDRQTAKFRGRKWYGGVLNKLRYKSINVDILFELVKQSGTNFLLYNSVAPGSLEMNASIYVLDRWQMPGDQTDVQQFSTMGPYQTAYSRLQGSDMAIADASFARLKNLSISWTVPDRWAGKIRVENVDLFIRGQNLMTITNYKGLDPETQFNVLPPLKCLTAGFRLTF